MLQLHKSFQQQQKLNQMQVFVDIDYVSFREPRTQRTLVKGCIKRDRHGRRRQSSVFVYRLGYSNGEDEWGLSNIYYMYIGLPQPIGLHV